MNFLNLFDIYILNPFNAEYQSFQYKLKINILILVK